MVAPIVLATTTPMGWGACMGCDDHMTPWAAAILWAATSPLSSASAATHWAATILWAAAPPWAAAIPGAVATHLLPRPRGLRRSKKLGCNDRLQRSDVQPHRAGAARNGLSALMSAHYRGGLDAATRQAANLRPRGGKHWVGRRSTGAGVISQELAMEVAAHAAGIGRDVARGEVDPVRDLSQDPQRQDVVALRPLNCDPGHASEVDGQPHPDGADARTCLSALVRPRRP